MTHAEAYQHIRNYLVEQMEIPKDSVKPEAHLFQDLHLDSIDALDMVGMLESEHNIDVNEEEITSIRTVQDMVNFLVQKLESAAPAA